MQAHQVNTATARPILAPTTKERTRRSRAASPQEKLRRHFERQREKAMELLLAEKTAKIPDDVATYRRAVADTIASKDRLLEKIYEEWHVFSTAMVGGRLTPPIIRLGEINHPRTLGHFTAATRAGESSVIVVRETLLFGRSNGDQSAFYASPGHFEDRLRFVIDILRHETLHQIAREIYQRDERHDAGHGPLFRALCIQWLDLEGGVGGGRFVAFPGDRRRKRCKPGEESAQHFPYAHRPRRYYGDLILRDEIFDDESEADPQ